MDKQYLIQCLENGMSTRDIEKDCGLCHTTVSYWISKYNLNDMGKYKKNPIYLFNKIDSIEKAYILGFILADGGISENNSVEISVSMKDKSVVEYIAKILNANITYDYTYNKKTRRFPRVRITKRIKDITKFTGGVKKSDRHYPRVGRKFEQHLLRGVFDADGCITWGRRKDRNRIWQKISFTSQYKILLGVQKFLLKNLDISTSIRPKGNSNCYILDFSSLAEVIRFCEYIYQDEKNIVLKRKYLKYKALRLELEENGESKQSA